MTTKIGQPYQGIWPEHPMVIPTEDGSDFDRPIPMQRGMAVRYPAVSGTIKRGIIDFIVGGGYSWNLHTVHFTNGDWCYETEVSEDRD
jgi:hypothetical protein